MGWNPEQYLKFAEARLRPALDLLGRVELEAPQRIGDLGCGAGNVTALLARRWPAAELTGVDSSPRMLEAARAALPGARWECADIATWQPPQRLDLLYSNAALQWLPDHSHLFPALLRLVATGGVLAVQMPGNFASPSHTAITETVYAGPWSARLAPLLRPVPVAAPDVYYRLLRPQAARIDIWTSDYLQVLEGPNPVKEWTKGTALKPFLDALDAFDAEAFEADYAERVRLAYPPQADGTTLFPFRRLFIVARRG
jgi:trans-aconitate 2-methyltransferase